MSKKRPVFSGNFVVVAAAGDPGSGREKCGLSLRLESSGAFGREGRPVDDAEIRKIIKQLIRREVTVTDDPKTAKRE